MPRIMAEQNAKRLNINSAHMTTTFIGFLMNESACQVGCKERFHLPRLALTLSCSRIANDFRRARKMHTLGDGL